MYDCHITNNTNSHQLLALQLPSNLTYRILIAVYITELRVSNIISLSAVL